MELVPEDRRAATARLTWIDGGDYYDIHLDAGTYSEEASEQSPTVDASDWAVGMLQRIARYGVLFVWHPVVLGIPLGSASVIPSTQEQLDELVSEKRVKVRRRWRAW